MAESKKKVKTVDEKILSAVSSLKDSICQNFVSKKLLAEQSSSLASLGDGLGLPRLATYSELKKATRTKIWTVVFFAFVVTLLVFIDAFFTTTALNNAAAPLIKECESTSPGVSCKVEHGKIIISAVTASVTPGISTASSSVNNEVPSTIEETEGTPTNSGSVYFSSSREVVINLSSNCWFSVEADGKTILGASYLKGEPKKFHFKKYAEIKDGCPGSLSLKGPTGLSEQKVPSSSGKTERIELSWF